MLSFAEEQQNCRTSAQWVMELKRNGLRLPRLLRAYTYSLIPFQSFSQEPCGIQSLLHRWEVCLRKKNIYYKPDVCL